MLHLAQKLRQGFVTWQAADEHINEQNLKRAFRDNWDERLGEAKFGGVWSIEKAKKNLRHPASKNALEIPRKEWTGRLVTVEHAVPINVLFKAFMLADSDNAMQMVLDAYFVAVVTCEEDKKLRNSGLSKSMPQGWNFGDDPLARWHHVGIQIDCSSPSSLPSLSNA